MRSPDPKPLPALHCPQAAGDLLPPFAVPPPFVLLSRPSGSPPPVSPTCPATSLPIPQAASGPGPKETSAVMSVNPAVTPHI